MTELPIETCYKELKEANLTRYEEQEYTQQWTAEPAL